MKKQIWILTILCFGIVTVTGCTKKPDIEFIDSGFNDCIIEEDNIELQYNITLVNNTDDKKYFYLYLNIAKEDDNLAKEDIIPAYEKDSNLKQVFMLDPNERKDDFFDVNFRGTHGAQEFKEDRNTFDKENLIIKEISKNDIPKDAKIYSLTEE